MIMATTTTRATPPAPRPKPIPRLENGDRLTRTEFERRYDAMPEVKKAELIEGVVYMGSPVRHDYHGQQHSDLNGWLVVYRAATPGVASSDNATVKLDPKNMPQPDCVLFLKPDVGGQARVDEGGYISGSPELAAEVAASSVSLDLGDKLAAYRRNGVREYLVWRVEDEQIDWFALRDGDYVRLDPGPDGILRSEVFPGLWLDPAAMLRGDLATVLAVLGHGTQSPAHAEFAATLKTWRTPQARET
jgi:hypothetical protein